MTWPHARPKPPRLNQNGNWDYQRQHPDVFTVFRNGWRGWRVEKAGYLIARRPTHAEAIEFVSAQLARRE